MANNLEAKICVLGAQGVGKTSLVNRYVSNIRPSPNTPSTIGASFLTKRTVDSESGIPLKLQIWDTAGQERFRSIARLYYRGASAVILVYSIASKKSFIELKRWMSEVRDQLGNDVLVHVVGTMSDLVQKNPELREVEMEEVISYAVGQLFEAQNIGQGMERSVSRRGRSNTATATTPTSGTGSKRHSGLAWETAVGWDICHEISAESGEGIDEVFRVVTRKLIDRHLIKQERDIAMSAAITPYSEVGGLASDYFGRPGLSVQNSFRLDGSKRKSWLSLSRNPSYAVNGERVNVDEDGSNAKAGCC